VQASSSPAIAAQTAPRAGLSPYRSAAAYGAVIFASAFLLFEVEPLIAKIILPWFGGVAAVWSVCLLFFQVVLLLGYLYAHLLTRKIPSRSQAWIHGALLVSSLLAIRILPRASWRPSGPEHPAFRILWLLCATVGLPYFVLATTSPLLQAWFSRQRAEANPYRFYALSNAGSMLALVAYPIAIEPFLTNSHQALAWEIAYGVAVALCFAIVVGLRGSVSVEHAEALASRAPAPPWQVQVLWLALAACGSALLLSVTNHISQNIAAVPFLWVLPLSLYLLSFILCFDSHRWYRRDLFLRMLGIALGAMTYALGTSFAGLPWKVLILLYCLGLFICCMFCHGELVRLKPPAQHLTSFYLMISLGGAIGATFVALVAPRIFSGYYEMEVSLALCALLVLVVHSRDPESRFYPARWKTGWLILAALVAVVIFSLFITAREQVQGTRLMVRNFYGELRVIDEKQPNVVIVQGDDSESLDWDPRYRKLMNGTIDHGLQFLGATRRREPTTYYGPHSGVGVALQAAGEGRPLRVGAIGLGAGTVAAYSRAGDSYTFYEINPLVVKVAEQEFTFLRDSPAQIRIVLGDARLSLEAEPPQAFDVLIVDAFSGDSIPVHLLTREAFELYFRQLQPQGVLAVHISNQYLDLQPIVEGAASVLGKAAIVVNHDVTNSNSGVYASTWILIGSRAGFLGQPAIEKAGQLLPPPPHPDLWTDNYSSLWKVLK